MRFDVIVGNPPYQVFTKGGQSQGVPIYNLFVEWSIIHSFLCSMIIPSRWLCGGINLDHFRQSMLNHYSIKRIIDYSLSTAVFNHVDIAGGILFFLYNDSYKGDCLYTYCDRDSFYTKNRKLNEYPIFVRDNQAIEIVHKVMNKKEKCIPSLMSSLSPFGLPSFERGLENNRINESENEQGDYYKLYSSGGISYIEKEKIKTGYEYIPKWKVIIGKSTSAGAATANKEGKRKVIATLQIIEPDSVCTFSYFIAGVFNTKLEAENYKIYLSTKFVRFLLFQSLSSINITKDKFLFVPTLDYHKVWMDSDLYKRYELNKDDIEYIESTIKSWSKRI